MRPIPDDVSTILNRLRAAGCSAYVVGGCVRDALLGREPKDWDVCTSCAPERMKDVFAGEHVVETGLKHGTLTVVLHHVPYEITTYRVDGAYTDHRHPDGVTFVTDVREDLARRDFTVNAMAYAPQEGLVDPFGGQSDLASGLLRCVGDPAERFTEDALRILRCLRFAAVYGFAVETATAQAARALAPTLTGIAAERIRVELEKLICGPFAAPVLRAFPGVVAVVLPELAPAFGFAQRTPYHRFDVWEHTLHALEAAPPEPTVRWTVLLHDSGKPAAFTLDADGVGHAYGHQAASKVLAQQAMTRLKMDRETFDRVSLLVEKHDVPLPAEPRLMKRRLNQLGTDALRQLIAVQRADALGKGTQVPSDVEALTEARLSLLDALLAQGACFSLKQLRVNGRDLLAAGIPAGPALGETLQALLDEVIDDRLPNDREALLDRARQLAGPGE